MPWNTTDYTKAPFNGEVLELTEEEILWAKAELERYASEYKPEENLGNEMDELYLSGRFTADHWEDGKFLNIPTIKFIMSYGEEQPFEEGGEV